MRAGACPASNSGKRTGAMRAMRKRAAQANARGQGDPRRPAGRAQAFRTARAARKNVRPFTRGPQRCAASKLNRGRGRGSLAARSHRHLRVELRKTDVGTFVKAIGIQEACKAGLAAGRKGGSGALALKSRCSGSPSKVLEPLVACRSRLREDLDALPCRY